MVSACHAHQCRIFIGVDDEVNIEVADDGIGLPVGHRGGVGIASTASGSSEAGMEAAHELGPKGKRVVRAMLPIGPRSLGWGGGGPRSGRQPAVERPGQTPWRRSGSGSCSPTITTSSGKARRPCWSRRRPGKSSAKPATVTKSSPRPPRSDRDVILMDLQLPGLNGLEATHLHPGSQPNVKPVRADDVRGPTYGPGRDGKGTGLPAQGHARGQALSRSVRAVANGDALFGPAVAERLIKAPWQRRRLLPTKRIPRTHRPGTGGPRTARPGTHQSGGGRPHGHQPEDSPQPCVQHPWPPPGSRPDSEAVARACAAGLGAEKRGNSSHRRSLAACR